MDDAPPTRWPEPGDDEIEVTLLGSYHMDNPGQDAVNVDADDVLSAARQAELETLAGRLASRAPALVAAEWPRERQADLDAVYDAYRGRDGDESLLAEYRRNEVVQIGCRLADRLGHDRVAAVDYPLRLERHMDEEPEYTLREGMERAAEDLDAYDFDPEAMAAERDERLQSSTLPEYFRWINSESNLHANEGMFAAGLSLTDPGDYVGTQLLVGWYDRNLRIVQHLRWAVEDDTESVLLVVGSGHVHVLRHLLDRAPMFCPVSPLPLLDGEGSA